MKRLFYIVVLFSLAFAQTPAKAQTTVLENFIAFNCIDTFDKVELINDIKAKHDTLILNCHVPDSQIEDDFQLRTCLEKLMPYNMRDITTPAGTPFSAINGRYLSSTNHSGIHHSAIALAAKENPLISIPFSLKDNTITAELPAIKSSGAPLDLWLYAYIFEKKDQALELPMDDPDDLPRATFVNMVKRLENLGEWGGKPQSISIPLHDFKADGFALIVQEKEGGMLAMGKIEPGLASQESRTQN